MGTLLGLSAGFAPGPLLALVIAETMQHDVKSGAKVALAPIFTDFPIIVLALFVLAKLSDFHGVLGVISLTGGLFILFLGYQNMRTRGVAIKPGVATLKPFTKGVLANALSPHPYLFWLSVGAPIMTRAMSQNISAAMAFVISFYVFVVGSKITLAILVGKSKSLLSGKAYIFTMRFLGSMLCVLALVLFRDGFKLLGII